MCNFKEGSNKKRTDERLHTSTRASLDAKGTSAMRSLSGRDMEMGRKRALRLSGSLDRPWYFFEAGFMVTKIPANGRNSKRIG